MVNKENKIIFIHIPRTGGTSIEEQFMFFGDTGEHECIKHLSARQIFSEVGEEIWNDYFKFTFVRNPWDRVISLYHMPHFNNRFRKPLLHPQPNIGVTSGNGLKFFLDNYKPASWEHLLYNDYLNYGEMDFVGRFENRNEHLSLISSKVGVEINDAVWERKTNHRHYSDYYDDETREMVGAMFEFDIKRFEYKFGE